MVETPTLLEEEREETLLSESEYSESCVIQFLNRTAKFTVKDILARQHFLLKIQLWHLLFKLP